MCLYNVANLYLSKNTNLKTLIVNLRDQVYTLIKLIAHHNL